MGYAPFAMLALVALEAFGKTAIEAMACGCVPMLPIEGGARDFATGAEGAGGGGDPAGANALFVDTTNRTAILKQLTQLIEDPARYNRLQANTRRVVEDFSMRKSAAAFRDLMAHAGD
jgi:glycosyltransferase involved in cell wall biosynthesis